VMVGDSGGSACNQAQLMKDSAKSGTPFFEGPMTALEKAKQFAIAKSKQFAQEIANKLTEATSDKIQQEIAHAKQKEIEEIKNKLYASVKLWGTDEKTIMSVTANATQEQKKAILSDKTLIKRLEKDLNQSEMIQIFQNLNSPKEALYRAMEGAGTKEKPIKEITADLTLEQKEELLNDKELIKRLEGDLSYPDMTEILANLGESSDIVRERLEFERKLIIAQMAADGIGIVEPTPFADISSGGISVKLGDPLGVGLSAVSIFPYLGDAFGKSAKEARTLARLKKMEELAEIVEKTDKLKKNLSVTDKTRDMIKVIEDTGDMSDIARQQLNRKLIPNTSYDINGYLYKTDELGRVINVRGKLELGDGTRNKYQQIKTGKKGIQDDEGGHLIGDRFGGPGEAINLVPQNSNLNRGAWKKMENEWEDALNQDKDVIINIKTNYDRDSVRPDSFTVKYSIDGKDYTRKFKNKPGG